VPLAEFAEGAVGAMRWAGRAVWKHRILVTGIVVAWVGLTYNPHWGFWISAAAACLILLLARFAFGETWRDRLGIAVGVRGRLVFLATLAVTVPVAAVLLRHMAARSGLEASLTPVLDRPGGIAFTTFQTLNEELVVGALLLLTLDRRHPGRRGVIGVAVAAVFALLHVALYASPHQRLLGATPVTLAPLTVLSLFLVGIARNNMILARGDIAMAWGLHLGFNVPFLVGSIFDPATGASPTEPARFDAVFGHVPMVAALAVLAAASFLLYRFPPARRGWNRRV